MSRIRLRRFTRRENYAASVGVGNLVFAVTVVLDSAQSTTSMRIKL